MEKEEKNIWSNVSSLKILIYEREYVAGIFFLSLSTPTEIYKKVISVV